MHLPPCEALPRVDRVVRDYAALSDASSAGSLFKPSSKWGGIGTMEAIGYFMTHIAKGCAAPSNTREGSFTRVGDQGGLPVYRVRGGTGHN